MFDKVKALGLLLERMDALYARVLALLELEREALIRLDYPTLYSAIREKDEVLSALRGLDRDRLRLQDYFGIVMDAPAEQVTLRFIGERLIEQGLEAEGTRLLKLRSSLGAIVDEIKGRLERNRVFIEKSVENLQKIAGHVSAAITGKPGASSRKMGTYTNKKQYEESSAHKGSILEKRL